MCSVEYYSNYCDDSTFSISIELRTEQHHIRSIGAVAAETWAPCVRVTGESEIDFRCSGNGC